MSLDTLIDGGIKNNSPLKLFVLKHYGELDWLKISRMIYARIQTQKFKKLYNKITLEINLTNKEPIVDELETYPCPQETEFGSFSVLKSDILNNEGSFITSGNHWTQVIYCHLPQTICQLGIKRKYFAKNKFIVYCVCNINSCSLKYQLVCTSTSEANLEFKILGSGSPDESIHLNKKPRNVSGQFRAKLASKVNEFGAKVVQNNMLLSKDLGQMNCTDEPVIKSLGCLRQSKHKQLAFSDLDSDNVFGCKEFKTAYRGNAFNS